VRAGPEAMGEMWGGGDLQGAGLRRSGQEMGLITSLGFTGNAETHRLHSARVVAVEKLPGWGVCVLVMKRQQRLEQLMNWCGGRVNELLGSGEALASGTPPNPVDSGEAGRGELRRGNLLGRQDCKSPINQSSDLRYGLLCRKLYPRSTDD